MNDTTTSKLPARKSSRADRRRGAAAVEAALVLPVLLTVLLGSIDIAQFINLSQLVTNASREGARFASRSSTNTVAEVEAAMHNYLRDSFPHLDAEALTAAAKVQVTDGENNSIQNGDLTNIASGDPILVDLAFDFSAVRWLPGPNYWNGNVNQSITACRRQ